ncbi:class I adenylate-forming enzyme family protein [Blastococcus saxobsidens]|uniref:AMP-dependent Acyl-CoA synthetase and ligase n=1 Tax=Blastococcus saxobsidens (strain DD2) TaxID=1146883 RepID=H6RRE6_BLASD|nr:AMP-binding protein [Blastococcus saxobsidens]CCG05428.1 AMP-dependent Acyl-CoA synthetase and ligase [Blastococcus saxobsidens DD2]
MTAVPLVPAADSERDQRRAAAGLAAAGLRPGDRLLVSAAASPALLAAVLGALRTGIVPVVLDPALPSGERAELAADAAAALDIGGEPARLLGEAEAELAPVPLGRPMHYTSGTTGRRKGVWSGVLAESDARALAAEEIELWGFGPGDRHLVLSPLHHSAPLRFAMHTLLAGGEVLLPGPFDAARVAETISTRHPTTAFCVPTHLQRLLAVPSPAHPVDWSSFRRLVHAGAPCPEPLKRAVLAALPEGSVWEFYGSTEAQFTVCSPEDWLAHPGSVGRARPGRRLETDERGQLWCAVPRWARFEYWRAPEKTAAAWRGDRVTVGDLGRVDDDGLVWLDGRREDLVISGGVNVYPAEVEAVLDAHPGVVESAVFGVPDPDWGQRLVAAYVGDADAHELAVWARDRLAPAKRPKSLHALADLPRTSTGKVRRLDLPGVLGLARG